MWLSKATFSLLCAGMASAFPAVDTNLLEPRSIDPSAPQGPGALPLVPPPFNPALQLVSTDGAHKFIAPGPTDARGPCPGLNSLANHGYIPRNGIATIEQFITACQDVFTMSLDLAGFLAIYGAILDGDRDPAGAFTTFSIGLKKSSAGGLLAGPTGLSRSHNNYESDSSAFKGDLNQYGNNVNLQMSQFQKFYDMQPDPATANYNLDVWRHFRKIRFNDSVTKNPYFTYLPFPGMQVAQAGHVFVYRMMGNKSAEYPEGILDKNVLKSFMSVHGPENNLVHIPGHERIPYNWYKRNPASQYSIPYLEADFLYYAQVAPLGFTVGCNQGRVNSYNAIDPATLTNGAYTAQQVREHPVCFASEFAIAELPGLTGQSVTLLAPLIARLKGFLAGMDCAAIGSVNMSAFAACPGFSNYGGPNGPIAPGAIQN